MAIHSTPKWLTGLLRLQLLFALNAAAVYAIFWAVGQPTDVAVVLLYSFCIGNLVVLARRLLRALCAGRSFAYEWSIFLAGILAITPAIVVASTLIGMWVLGPPAMSPPLWNYLAKGWKFPSLAAVLFGVVYHLYQDTRNRLEKRNRELETVVQSGEAQIELHEEELQRAREIQQGLLPREIPQVAGFEITGAWEPARVVSGDYFDAIRLSQHTVAICIADVVGKSISAALLMANVQATVRAFASATNSPALLCQRINSILCETIAIGKFVSLFYAVLDAEQRTLRYANAGHPAPIVVHDSGDVERLAIGGAVLGVFPEARYEEGLQRLAGGDRVLLFTDGITEATNGIDQEFGEDRVVAAARAANGNSPEELKQGLLTTLKQFCNAKLHDDATLVVVGASNTEAAARKAC